MLGRHAHLILDMQKLKIGGYVLDFAHVNLGQGESEIRKLGFRQNTT